MKIHFSIGELHKEIQRRIKIASDSLLENDIPTAKENIEWVQIAKDIIEQSKKKPTKVKWAIIVGIVSVLLIGLGFSIRIPTTNLSVDIVTRSVSFKLEKEWVLNNRFSLSELTITNLREVSVRGPNIHLIQEQPFTINLKGENIIIDKFVFSSNAEITIRFLNNTYAFIVKNDTLVTDVQVGKAQVTIDNSLLDTAVNFEIPELFHIKSFPSVTIPIDILLIDTATWRFRDMWISDINFLEETTPGSGQFISAIRSGQVKVLEIDKVMQLEEGDWLILENLKNRRIQLRKSELGLVLHMEGEVSQAKGGSELFEKNLNPTLIEYLYYAKTVGFFWSAIVFMCSFIWSLRNTLFSS